MNIGFKVTVEYTCLNMVDEKILKEEFNNDPLAVYKFVSNDFEDSPDNFSESEEIVKVEILTFKCKSCGNELPVNFQMRTEGYCYLCDPKVTVEELLK